VLGLQLALAMKRINDGERVLTAKMSMVRYISHEIRTPLNTTSIGVEVLEHELSSLGSVIPSSITEVIIYEFTNILSRKFDYFYLYYAYFLFAVANIDI
jgi:signal transduction histidine kinase